MMNACRAIGPEAQARRVLRRMAEVRRMPDFSTGGRARLASSGGPAKSYSKLGPIGQKRTTPTGGIPATGGAAAKWACLEMKVFPGSPQADTWLLRVQGYCRNRLSRSGAVPKLFTAEE